MYSAALIPDTGAAASRRELSPELFERFVKWIDRSEKTARTYIVNLRQFVAWLRCSSITSPTREDVIAYRDYLAAEHDAIQLDGGGWKYRTDGSGSKIKLVCRASTVKAYMQSVCAFFKWTASEGLYPNIAENIHTPKLKSDTHKKDALNAQEVQEVITSIRSTTDTRLTAAEAAKKDKNGRIRRITEQGKRLYAMYLLTVTAGLRTVELSRANVKDLECKNGCYCLYIFGKGHSEADTKKAIAPEVGEAIKDYLNSRAGSYSGNSPLFAATGNRSGGKRLAPTTISTMLKRALQAAGFDSERLTAHSLRHTAGTNAMQLTGDIYATQKYMRHSNPQTTEIYLHIDTEKEEADIAQRLYNAYQGIESKTDSRRQLEEALHDMKPEQIEQLAAIAKAMQK